MQLRILLYRPFWGCYRACIITGSKVGRNLLAGYQLTNRDSAEKALGRELEHMRQSMILELEVTVVHVSLDDPDDELWIDDKGNPAVRRAEGTQE